MPIIGASAPTVQAWEVNVKDYGAKGDLNTDDTTAIKSAIAAVRAITNSVSGNSAGVSLIFPPGYYKVTQPLDLSKLAQVRILGGGGRSSFKAPDTNGVPAIAYYGGTSSPAVDLRSSQACIWDGVNVYDRGGLHTGPLMSFDRLADQVPDVFGNRVQNCTLTTFEGHPTSLLKLAGNIEFSAVNVTFSGVGTNGQVHLVDPTAASTWCNANSFTSCSFLGGDISVLNPGPQTLFSDCTWEPGPNGASSIKTAALGNETAGPVTFESCGFWDSVSGTNPWVWNTVPTKTWAFIGCKFDCSPSAIGLFDMSAHTGLTLMACRLTAPNGGTPNVFAAGKNITNGVMLGCEVASPLVDNHASVFL